MSLKFLPALLSIIAGSVDVISFLALNGLFISHITGNLVILAVQIVTVDKAPLALILSVPVFIIVLGLTKLLVFQLDKLGWRSLPTLLLLQFLLLIGFLLLGISHGPHIDPSIPIAVLAGMLGVSAMAVQNALVQLSLTGAPATAVMTTNVTRFVLHAGTALLSSDAQAAAEARMQANAIWPTIVGFTLGCAGGAICEAGFGLWALGLPVLLALIALLIYGR